MSFLSKIIPFYGAIEAIVDTAGEAIREDQKRRTIRTEAEMKVYLETEVKRRNSVIEEAEKQAALHRELEKAAVNHHLSRDERDHKHTLAVEKQRVEAELADMPERLRHERTMAMNEHRVGLYSRVKRLELEIQEQISKFHVQQQQALTEWQFDFTRRLEDHKVEFMMVKAPAMLVAAEKFRENEPVYASLTSRVFRVLDDAIESIARDQEMFRNQLVQLHNERGEFTKALVDMQRRLELSGT